MTPPNESPYAFRRRLRVVHQPDRRDAARPRADEVAVGEGWAIVVGDGADPLVFGVAQDLQDYLLVSMGESVVLRRVSDVAGAARTGERVIVLATAAGLGELPDQGTPLPGPRSYRVTVRPGRVVVAGADPRGAAQGSYYLEDAINLRGAPFLPVGEVTREPLFSPRMVHSGYALDQYPDAHLNAIAHAGMDAILLFITGVDRTPDEQTHHQGSTSPGRYQDVNELVDRAAAFGLDVYYYAYFRHTDPPWPPHPDDPGAADYYRATFGAVFRACPRVKGIILVGESVEFPSRDPRTTGRMRLAPSPDGLPPTTPSPGWWPCDDYPRWLALVTRVVREANPQADVVFWTYNWGYAPEADRLALVRALPGDVSLQVTFEMFEPIRREGITNVCVDYTVSFAGPGAYFRSEAGAARERGLRLYTMCNTGGLTWDFGCIPYEPVPYQWARRHAALLRAREERGLAGLMESHHYGWWPSFVSELAKWAYWRPSPTPDEVLAAIARRDFGTEGAPEALAAWRAWSEAILDYVPTNEDQYGPFRTGPAFPLVFRTPARLPTASHAMFGHRIVITDYQPREGRRAQSPGPMRLEVEIRALSRMVARWEEGLAHLERAAALAPPGRREAAERLLDLGTFIRNAVRTTINVKAWWRLRHRVLGESDPQRAAALLDEMAALAEREIANAEATIPLVERDSRLGWEPTMDYVADAAHLRWKVAQVRRVLDHELPAYRATLTQPG